MDALAHGAREADLVVASGGVSVGDEDHVKPAVRTLGALDLWNVAIRPGKPVAFGRIGDTPFFGGPWQPGFLVCRLLPVGAPTPVATTGRGGRPYAAHISGSRRLRLANPDTRPEFHRARIQTGEPMGHRSWWCSQAARPRSFFRSPGRMALWRLPRGA